MDLELNADYITLVNIFNVSAALVEVCALWAFSVQCSLKGAIFKMAMLIFGGAKIIPKQQA